MNPITYRSSKAEILQTAQDILKNGAAAWSSVPDSKYSADAMGNLDLTSKNKAEHYSYQVTRPLESTQAIGLFQNDSGEISNSAPITIDVTAHDIRHNIFEKLNGLHWHDWLAKGEGRNHKMQPVEMIIHETIGSPLHTGVTGADSVLRATVTETTITNMDDLKLWAAIEQTQSPAYAGGDTLKQLWRKYQEGQRDPETVFELTVAIGRMLNGIEEWAFNAAVEIYADKDCTESSRISATTAAKRVVEGLPVYLQIQQAQAQVYAPNLTDMKYIPHTGQPYFDQFGELKMAGIMSGDMERETRIIEREPVTIHDPLEFIQFTQMLSKLKPLDQFMYHDQNGSRPLDVDGLPVRQ